MAKVRGPQQAFADLLLRKVTQRTSSGRPADRTPTRDIGVAAASDILPGETQERTAARFAAIVAGKAAEQPVQPRSRRSRSKPT